MPPSAPAALTAFGPGIWLADGPVVTGAGGFPYPTRMAVIRLSNGGLFIWSPTPLTPDLQTAIDALGPVRHIVAPNALHHLFLPDWAAAYPAARLHGPAALHRKRRDIAFHSNLTATPDPGWAGEIDQLLFDTRLTPELVFFHRASGTILFTDLIQHLPRSWFTGWRALIARADLMTGAQPTVPRKFRLALRQRRAARAAIDTLLSWQPQALVFAHGAPVTRNVPDVLRQAFRWLR